MLNVFVFQVKPFKTAWIFAVIYTFLIGIIIEIIQKIMKEDDPSWRDVVANTIGIALAVLTILWG